MSRHAWVCRDPNDFGCEFVEPANDEIGHASRYECIVETMCGGDVNTVAAHEFALSFDENIPTEETLNDPLQVFINLAAIQDRIEMGTPLPAEVIAAYNKSRMWGVLMDVLDQDDILSLIQLADRDLPVDIFATIPISSDALMELSKDAVDYEVNDPDLDPIREVLEILNIGGMSFTLTDLVIMLLPKLLELSQKYPNDPRWRHIAMILRGMTWDMLETGKGIRNFDDLDIQSRQDKLFTVMGDTRANMDIRRVLISKVKRIIEHNILTRHLDIE